MSVRIVQLLVVEGNFHFELHPCPCLLSAWWFEHQVGPLVDDLEDKVSKERVGPSEPWAGEVREVVLAEGLMDKAGASGRVHESLKHARDFCIGDSSPASRRQCHRPNVPKPNVRTADARCRRALSLQEIVR